nr:copia protein [Tanacetum cinerariifolium]
MGKTGISILLALGTPSTGSGNSLLAVGMPCVFYSQQHFNGPCTRSDGSFVNVLVDPKGHLPVQLRSQSKGKDRFVDPYHPEKVYLLRKELYGVTQAPRSWYDEHSTFMISKDADHAGCLHTRQSTFRGIQFLGYKLVCWMFKKQDCTTMSTSEADNVALSASYAQHSPTKHISVRYHFIKEQVENGIVELYYVRTDYQLANMFTKSLSKERFWYLVGRLGQEIEDAKNISNVHHYSASANEIDEKKPQS